MTFGFHCIGFQNGFTRNKAFSLCCHHYCDVRRLEFDTSVGFASARNSIDKEQAEKLAVCDENIYISPILIFTPTFCRSIRLSRAHCIPFRSQASELSNFQLRVSASASVIDLSV